MSEYMNEFVGVQRVARQQAVAYLGVEYYAELSDTGY